MKAVELRMKPIAPNVLSIHCPGRYVLRRLLEYFDHIPAVAAHSKMLAGPAVWFRTETEADLHKIRESIAELAFPLFATEAAVRPPWLVRHFWLMWAALWGIYYSLDIAVHIFEGTPRAIFAYAFGLGIISLSLWNHGMTMEAAAARIRTVQELFRENVLETAKDEAKE